jgi:polysulfide reductase chain C
MNQLWGSMEQYNIVAWHWQIAVYLFLAGLSAGAVIAAIIIKQVKNDGRKSEWDGIVKAGAILSPVAIAAGLLLLIGDLTRPFNFWKLLINFNVESVMSIGVLALFIYFPLTLVFLLIVFQKKVSMGNLKFLKPLADIALSLSKTIEILTIIFAVIVGAYTGFLLSAMNSHPLFNTPVLPALFLASGVSSGICADLIIGILFFNVNVKKENALYLHAIDTKQLIFIELFFLFILFVGMFYQGGDSANVAKMALKSGFLANVFWFGVVLVGLLLPIGFNVALPDKLKHSYKFMVFNAFIVLIGVFLLRFYILFAGQVFVG